MGEAHVCPLGADEDDGVTYARTHAGGFFRGGGVFWYFCLFVFFGKRGGHMYVCVAEGQEEVEGEGEGDDDDVFHVFELGGRAHGAEK